MGSGFRNQADPQRDNWGGDNQVFRTDERFAGGRGGEGYWEDQTERGDGVQAFRGGGNAGAVVDDDRHRRTDDRIRDAVVEALADDGSIDASDIEVIVQNGDVFLTGLVGEDWQSRRAEDIARGVGAHGVQNNLRLDERGNRDAGIAVGKNETDMKA